MGQTKGTRYPSGCYDWQELHRWTKGLSLKAFDSTRDNQGSMHENMINPRDKLYPGMIIQKLEDGWRDTPKSPQSIHKALSD
ncbi:hypothetical protein H5410_038575 [Solanum commersonii]|uniref:Uncharacterized protein n=1 Tax=Solanum commersonii TaxID=4109 RepID=A0A9J5YBR8_SOLCO|nr:hypothetical protein H5410_038575 [Solanum commersonii]